MRLFKIYSVASPRTPPPSSESRHSPWLSRGFGSPPCILDVTCAIPWPMVMVVAPRQSNLLLGEDRRLHPTLYQTPPRNDRRGLVKEQRTYVLKENNLEICDLQKVRGNWRGGDCRTSSSPQSGVQRANQFAPNSGKAEEGCEQD
jgi:hypothetical protein